MIQINNVSKSYVKDKKSVDVLNLEIRNGEIFGFLGPNGAGKTTTIKMMTGILNPDAGDILIDGKSIQKEALEAKKEGKKITTSCCPAFVDLLKLKFPKVYENHTSNVLSPMAITARMARKKYPNAKTVFVGPCVAKKTERLLQKNRGNIDYVLTFEEITAMFAAKGIDPIQLQGESNVVPGSPSGRNFCVTGGVAGSLNAYLQEIGETERLTLKKANGNVECIKFVKELQAGKQVEDVLEGMMCEGGCIAGVDSQVANALLINGLAKAENEQVKSVTIESSKEGFEDIDCYFDKSIN